MSEETVVVKESVVSKITGSVRLNLWKFVGALVMEEKNGIQAVSMQKFLGLCTYAACMWIWLRHGGEVSPEIQTLLTANSIDVPKALQAAGQIPESMLYTLWGLLAINGGSKIAGIIKGE